jgi:hypothetical protein
MELQLKKITNLPTIMKKLLRLANSSEGSL